MVSEKGIQEATILAVSRKDQLHPLLIELFWSFLKLTNLMTNPNLSPSNLMILFLSTGQKEFILTYFSTTFYISQDLCFFSFLSFQRSDAHPFFQTGYTSLPWRTVHYCLPPSFDRPFAHDICIRK